MVNLVIFDWNQLIFIILNRIFASITDARQPTQSRSTTFRTLIVILQDIFICSWWSVLHSIWFVHSLHVIDNLLLIYSKNASRFLFQTLQTSRWDPCSRNCNNAMGSFDRSEVFLHQLSVAEEALKCNDLCIEQLHTQLDTHRLYFLFLFVIGKSFFIFLFAVLPNLINQFWVA